MTRSGSSSAGMQSGDEHPRAPGSIGVRSEEGVTTALGGATAHGRLGTLAAQGYWIIKCGRCAGPEAFG